MTVLARTDGRSRTLLRALLGSAAIALAAAPELAKAASPAVPSGNQIVPTGRTATSVTVNGAVTDITTGTVTGGNAYNDFSRFNTVSGTTVDLQVPGGANNLVNVVRDAPATVNGVLNSYKNGRIGGNVVFADPYGFVVGESGVINTGSLTVRTPTKAFLDQLISPSGAISSTAAAALQAGDIPVSPDGLISIRGKVNAAGSVVLAGQSVRVGRDPASVQAAKFAATVNQTGLKTGAAIVSRHGGIDIVAAGDASINGRLATGASAGRNAGAVHVTAGRNVRFGASTVIDTHGVGAHSSGGAIVVKAGQDLALTAGATFSSYAGTSGDGGNIEISAVGKETLSGGTYNAGATAGKAGSVSFDPAVLEISGTTTTNGADYTMSGGSITIDAGAVIVTRQVAAGLNAADPTVASTGNSGNITIALDGTNGASGTLTVGAGAQLLAFATDTYAAGNIALNAGTQGTVAFATDPNLAANAVLATRVIASGTGASLSSSVSTGNSGNITLSGAAINLGTGINTVGTANTAPGEQFLANAAAPTVCATMADCTPFKAGAIALNVTGSYAFSSAAPVLTEGANLVVNATGTVTFGADSLINTRHQAAEYTETGSGVSTTYFSPMDPTSAILDNPGNVTVTASSVAFGGSGLNVAGGAAIYAGGYGGAAGFLPGTITLNVPNFSVSGTIASAGAHLTLNATSGNLSVAAGTVLATREVAAGADPTDATIASTDVSGDLTLSAAHGDVVIGAQTKLLTFSTDSYYAGNIAMTASGNVIFTAPSTGQSPAELVARSVSSTATDAATTGYYGASSAPSGNVSFSAGSIQLNGGLNDGAGPTVLAGAAVAGQFQYEAGTITFTAPTVALGSNTTFNTLGANLVLDGTQSVSLAANSTINTRDVASGADPAAVANGSTENSGNVTLVAPAISLAAGATINTSAVGSYTLTGGSVAALPGNVSLQASNSLVLASGASGVATIEARGVAAGASSYAAGVADAAGGNITISAPSIDLSNGLNGTQGAALLAAGGTGFAAGTIALTENSVDLSTTLDTLGANLTLTAQNGNVTLENSAVIDTTSTGGAAGDITLSGVSIVLPNNAFNQSQSATLRAIDAGGAGTVTFSEVANLDFTTAYSANNPSGATLDAVTNGASFVLETTGTLSLGSNLTIDTRDLSSGTVAGAAGSIGLSAGSIVLGSGFNGASGSWTATLLASAGNGYAPGTILLQWTGSEAVTLSSGASFNSAGANLAFDATGDVTIADQATINAGNNTASVFGNTVQFAPTSTFDASAVKLGETSTSANFELSSNESFAGINLTIATETSITIDAGVTLSTRKTNPLGANPSVSTGNSGSITLEAPTITVLGTLDASVESGSTFTAGDVTLQATQIEQPISGFDSTTATTTISLGNKYGVAATIKGGNVQLLAAATADAEPFATLVTGEVTFGMTSILQVLGSVNGAVQLATASSTSHLFTGSTINATGDVVVQASSNTTASDTTPETEKFLSLGLSGTESGFTPSLSRLVGNPLNAAFSVMEATATATATVDSGATITAAGTVTVRAHNTDLIHSEESVASTNNTVDIALAYSSATINSTATIANGAIINAGAVRVVARNDNAWETAGDVSDLGQGKGGIVLALSEDSTSNATAQMNANLSLASTLPSDADAGLLVEAQSITTSDVVSASADSGTGDITAKVLGRIGGTDPNGLADVLNNSKLDGQLNNVFSNNTATQERQIRFAFGVALNLGNEQSASATIGGSTGATAPTIDSPAGPVAVIADVTDSGVQTQALSTIRSTTYGKDNTSFSGTTYGFGAAVALTDLSHDADAEIGVQTSVTAPAVGVTSTVYMPLFLPYADWGTPNAKLTNLTMILPSILQDSSGEVDTTGASAIAGAQQLGVAGSFNFFHLKDTSTAWVDQGANIAANPASGSSYSNGNWSVATGSESDANGGFTTPADNKASFTSTVAVLASDKVAAIDIGGDADVLSQLHPAKSASSSAGAAVSLIDFSQTTEAGIANAATVDTSGSLAVDANALDFVITIVPSDSNSGQLAVSGMVGVSILDNTTEATISNTADITAGAGLALQAEQDLNSSIVAGSVFEQASTVAFGIGVAINLPTADTEAYIGDNSAIETIIDPNAALTSTFAAPTAGVSAPSASVFALTSGQVLSLGLAGSVAKSDSTAHETPTKTSANSNTGDFTSYDTGQSILNKLAVLDKVLPDWPTGPEMPELPDFGLAVSGSAAVVQDSLTTKAYVDGAKITDEDTSSHDAVNVSAVRNLWLISGAGGFAATVANSSQTNVGIAGAVAVDISSDTTDAYIAGNSTVSGFNTVQVAALEGGQQIDVGIDLALNKSSGGTSIGVAVSASIGIVNDGVGAWIDSSTITGQGDTGVASVTAYDNTNIGLGGGAFLVNVGADSGGSAGVGLTVGMIGDPTTGDAVDAHINNSQVTSFEAVSVDASSAGRIIMGAVSAAVSTQSTGVGAITYAQIDTTTNAAVTDSSTINARTVSVTANAGDQSAYDKQLSQYGRVAYSSVSDFSGSSVLKVLDSGSQGTAPTKIGTGGAAIIAVAGTISVDVPGEDSEASANVGLQLTINDVADTYEATVSDSSITTPTNGSVTVAANDSATILAVSAGAAVTVSSSDSFNLTGLASLTINLNSDKATATVGNASGSQYSTSISTGTLSVTADNAAITDGFAGNVDISTGDNSAAFGAAIAFGQDKQTTSALLTNSKLNVDGQTAVDAFTNPICTGGNCPVVPYTIADAAFTVAGSGSFAFAGAVTANVVENATTAQATAISLNDPNVWTNAYPALDKTSLVVMGSDNSTVATLAVSVAAAETAGVGAGISYGDMANTVKASIDGGGGPGLLTPAIDVGSALVQATSTPNIKTLAAGVAGGQNIGIGGSIVTNFVGLDTSRTPVATATATIDQGAIVSALGNVYVLADDNSSIQVIAGSLGVSAGGEPGVGIGLGVVFNDIQTAAKAEVANSTVDAEGQYGLTAGKVNAVNDGTLQAGADNAPDLSKISAPQATTYPLAEVQQSVRGLAVDATATEQVIADTVSVGFQASEEPGAGIGANVLVNIMGGSTTADITSSKIDTLYGAQSLASSLQQPDVFVNASSHAFAGDFVAAAAFSGYAGLAGAADTSSVSRTTTADISGGQIGSVINSASSVTNPYNPTCATSCDESSDTLTTTTLTPVASIGTVTVNAATTADTADIVVGAAGSGIASGAGSVAVDIFQPTTTAYVGAGTPVVANNLSVVATTENGNNMLGGAAAGGGAAGAGSFGVLVSDDTTNAYVGDQADDAAETTLTLTGALSVQSTMTDNFNSLVVSGAAGGSVGVAGMADVLVVTNATTAGLYLVTTGKTDTETSHTSPITQPTSGTYVQTVTNRYGRASQLTAPTSVSVDATETLNIAAKAGSLGIGGSTFGLGAGAGVIVLKSNTTAVADGDTLNTTGSVQVDATSTKTIQATAVSLGAGGSAGIGASALLILVGSAPSGALDDIESELNASGSGTLSKTDSAGSSNSGASDPTTTPAAPTYSVTDTINDASSDAVTAAVEGGTVTASAIDVDATSSISTSSIVGGAGLGGTLGVGGGVGYTLIYDTVTATLSEGTFKANTISVTATAQDASPALSDFPGSANVLAIAGGAGLVGLGAAYANGTIDDTVSASAGGTLATASSLPLVSGGCATAQTSCLTVAATDSASDTVGAYGAEIGAAAVGVVVGQAYKTSSVSASVLGGSKLSGFSTTSIDATQGGALTAKTVGAAGGLLAAGTGAASTALTLTQVTASTGSNVVLPDGDVSLIARNNPIDITSALGVAAGGYFAAGVGVAISDAGDAVSDTSQPVDQTKSIYTAATLGAGTTTDASRTGSLTLSATSVSIVDATGTAGAGGGAAGAAAVGKTNDTALTEVTLNDPTGTLYAGAVTLTSDHTTNFAGQSNAIAAAVVGGSGAETDNGGDVSTSITLGGSSTIKATGAVTISALDTLTETVSGDVAQAAAGGVLSGSAVVASSNYTLGVTITLGNSVNIASGTDPVSNPGALAIGAGILVDESDTAELNTGGVLDGASVSNSLTLTSNTDVEIGSSDKLESEGALGIGSFIQVDNAAPDAYANTYGLASVGAATSTVTITASQTTHVGSSTTINGLGSVWVTAGLDPSGSIPTIINGAPNATAYAYGLVGVPDTHATATLTSNTTMTVDQSAAIDSALNVTLGGYPGAPYASPVASGHGDVLGVPTTDGSANSNTSSSAVVAMNGSALAGEYNTLLINIDTTKCDAYGSCIANQVEGRPTTITYDEDENLVSLIDQDFPTEPAHGSALAGVPTGGTPTVTIGTLYAAGGLVYLNASQLSGSGSLTANGGPSITVNNATQSVSLVFGEIEIPAQAGGSVIFTGAANGSSDPHLVVTGSSSNVGQVTINSTVPGLPGDVPPDLIFTGAISAITGNVSINNSYGSIATANSVIAISATLTAPNGIDTIGNGTTPEYLAEDPFSEWDASIVYPGGNPSNGTPDANIAAAYAANAIYGNYSNETNSTFSGMLYGSAQGNSSPSGAGSNGTYKYVSQVWFGNCLPAAAGDCSQGTAEAISNEIGAGSNHYTIDPNGGPNYYYFAMVPVENLAPTVSVVPNTSAFTNAMGGIEARQITVQGSFIAIGGDLVLGSPTTVAVDIPSSDIPLLAFLHDVRAAPYTLLTDSNKKPLVTYDGAQNQLVVANINAAATASQLLLDGQIVGTNPNGQISVNTGLGTATVTNETGVPLTVNNINAGSVATNLTSTVQIVDTLTRTNNVYRYTTGQGLQHSETSDLTMFCTAGADCTNGAEFTNANTATFTPKPGTEIDWTMQAKIDRTASGGGIYSNWAFDLPSGTTNPWQYVGADNALSTTPVSTLVTPAPGQTLNSAFSETITASQTNQSGTLVYYHGCGSDSCHYDFPANSNKPDGNGGNGWYFSFPTAATIDLSMRVKADYAFGINFGGSTTGSIAVTSNSPITVGGTLFNPNGTTTLTSSGSSTTATQLGLTSAIGDGIYASNGASIAAGALTLTTTGAIGTSTVPVPVAMTLDPTSHTSGVLTASAGSQGINLAIQSGATLGNISASDSLGYGDVNISAQSDLTAKAGTTVTGRNITVDVASGGLGASGAPVNLTPNGSGRASGGLVNISALGSVYIERDGGNLLAGTIESKGGDVSIAIPDGALLDASAETPLSVLSPSQVAVITQRLGLSADGESNASVQANTVNPIQATVDGDYAAFWNLKDTLLPNGTVSGTLYAAGSTFSISSDPNSAAYKIYAPLAQQHENALARAAGTTPTKVTSADVEAYVNSLYQSIVTQYAPTFAQYYGADWQTVAAFTAESAAPAVFSNEAIKGLEVSSSQNAAALLKSAVSYNALQPAGTAVIGIGTPNVVGHSVTISEATSIGRLGTPVEIPFDKIQSGKLTDGQAEALGLATAPGQASFEVTTPTGKVSIPITQLSLVGTQYYYTPAGGTAVPVTPNFVVITEPAPLFVAVNGSLNVTTTGPVFAQSTIPDLPIGAISAQGSVSLSAPEAITSATTGTTPNIETSGGGVSLATESGSIGTAAQALTISVTNAPATGALTDVSAGANAYLNYVGGDLTIGSVFANGAVSINASSSVYAAGSGVNITAGSIDLVAKQNIGTSAAALAVEVGSDGLSGSARGDAYFDSPKVGTGTPATFTVDNFTAHGILSLSADGSISASHVTAQTNDLTVASGDDVTLESALSGGTMTVTAAADITVGALTTLGASHAISLTAGAKGILTVEAAAAVQSGGDVTTSSASLAMLADATLTAGGAVDLTTTGDALLGNVLAKHGTLTVVSNGTAGRILSNGDVHAILTVDRSDDSMTLKAGGDIGAATLPLVVATTSLSATSQHGSIWIDGQGNLSATLLSALGGAVDVSATGTLSADQAKAGQSLTLVGATGLVAGDVQSTGNASLTATHGDLTLTDRLQSQAGAEFDALHGNATLPNVTTATFLTVDAGDQIKAGVLRSGGLMTLDGAAVSFANLTTTIGGDIDVTATLGNIVGSAQGEINSVGGVTLEAKKGNATVPSIKAHDTVTVTAKAIANLTQVESDGTEDLTAGTLQLGTVTTHGDKSDPGDLIVDAGTGGVTAGTIQVAGAARIMSGGDALLTDVTSGASITADVDGKTTFHILTAKTPTSDVELTVGGLISGHKIDAARNVGLTSTGSTIDVDVVIAETGGVAAGAKGDVTLPSVTAATTFGAQGADLVLGTAQSGGTQTLGAVGTIGFVQLTSTGTATDPGDIGLTAGGAISGNKIDAARNVGLTSTGSTIDVDVVIAETGGVAANAKGDVTLPSVTAATTFGAQGADLVLGTAQSGGTQTLGAVGTIGFVQLTSTGTATDPGDIGLTAGGAIAGNKIDAARNVGLTSTGSTIDVDVVIAETGGVAANAKGDVTLPDVTAATTFGAQGADLMLGTAQSGGTQTLGAVGTIGFVQLTSTGTATDPGDIGLTAGGAISGHKIDAARSVGLTSTGSTIDVDVVVAEAGSITAGAKGDVTLPSVTATTTFGAQGADLVLGTAQSGGTQTLGAVGTIGFVQLTSTGTAADPGDIGLTAGGAISGHEIDAARNVGLTSTGSTIDIGVVIAEAGSVTAGAKGDVTLPSVTAATTFGAQGADLVLGTAQSGGTQTLGAVGTIGFVQLTSTGTATDPGDIGLTAGGAIAGNKIDAARSVGLTSTGSTIDIGVVIAEAGSVTAGAKGDVTLPSVTAATTFGAQGADLVLGTAQSGGTQTLGAVGTIGFIQLTSTGTATDPGDIGLTAGGAIAGNKIDAARNVGLTSTGSTIDVDVVVAEAGSITAGAKGDVTLPSVTAATTFEAEGADLVLGTAMSGGTQTLGAVGTIGFIQLTSTGTATDPGDIGLTAGGAIDGHSIVAARNADLTSTKGTIDVDLVKALSGAVSASGFGDVTLPSVSAATTFAASSDANLVLGTAISGGTQTLGAGGTIGFVELTTKGTPNDAGDIGLTAGGAIAGHGIVAARNAAIASIGGTIDVDAVTAMRGGVNANGFGDVTLPSVSAATTFVAASGADLQLGTAVSGGTQTLGAAGTIGFVQLTTTSTSGDPGDIGLTAGSTVAGQTILAARNVALLSNGGAIVVDSVTATRGAIAAGGFGDVKLETVTAATTFGVLSGANILLGTAVSGGTQTLVAGDEVRFAQLTTHGLPTDPGDVDVTALTGPILGGNINAAGSVYLNGRGIGFGTILAGYDGTLISSNGVSGGQVSVGNDLYIQSGPGDLDLGQATGRTLDLEAGHAIDIAQITVRDGLILRAQIIDGSIDQSAGVTNPLSLEVTGPNGSLAQNVDLQVGAPNGLLLPRFDAIDATVVTTADKLFGQFDVTEKMMLQTAETTLMLDNTDPGLRPGVDVQLYQPGGRFFLSELGKVSATNAYVVAYLQDYQTFSAAFDNGHVDAYPEFDGTSVSRDAAWNTAEDLRRAQSATDDDETALRLLLAGLRHPGLLVTTTPGVIGPAVNLNR